ncbi:MAG: hypothetical protein ACTTJS_03270 [Wolinella sp.]
MSQGFDKNTFKFSNIANINSSAWTGANASLGAITGRWFVMYSKVGLWIDNSNSAGSGYHSCARLTIYPSG